MHRFASAAAGALLWFSPAVHAAAPVPAELPPAPQPSEVIAEIGGQRITYGELPETTHDALAKLQHDYAAELQLVYLKFERSRQNLIETSTTKLEEDALLRKEAEAEHSTAEKLAGEHLTVAPPTEAQVKEFYDASQIDQPLPQVAAAIAARLQRDAAERAHHEYFAMLATKYSARVTLAPLRQPIEPTGPARGPAGAAVTVVEFADFQCPFCRQMEPVLQQVLAHYPRDVRLVYRYMPLTDLHRDALRAAKAGFCASAQGKFWEMHDAMFADQTALTSQGLAHTAQVLQLDRGAFAACMKSDQGLAAISADYEAAVAAGVSGTPGLFVNGRYLSGAVSYDKLSDLIEDELRRSGAPSAARLEARAQN